MEVCACACVCIGTCVDVGVCVSVCVSIGVCVCRCAHVRMSARALRAYIKLTFLKVKITCNTSISNMFNILLLFHCLS